MPIPDQFSPHPLQVLVRQPVKKARRTGPAARSAPARSVAAVPRRKKSSVALPAAVSDELSEGVGEEEEEEEDWVDDDDGWQDAAVEGEEEEDSEEVEGVDD